MLKEISVVLPLTVFMVKNELLFKSKNSTKNSLDEWKSELLFRLLAVKLLYIIYLNEQDLRQAL